MGYQLVLQSNPSHTTPSYPPPSTPSHPLSLLPPSQVRCLTLPARQYFAFRFLGILSRVIQRYSSYSSHGHGGHSQSGHGGHGAVVSPKGGHFSHKGNQRSLGSQGGSVGRSQGGSQGGSWGRGLKLATHGSEFNIHTGKELWALRFHDCVFSGMFFDRLMDALHRLPAVQALHFGQSKGRGRKGGAGAMLDESFGQVLGTLPPWIKWVTLDNVLSPGALRMLVMYLHAKQLQVRTTG